MQQRVSYLSGAYPDPDAGVLGSTEPSAVTLGRFVNADGSFGKKANYGEDRHVLLFGPNGSGKGMRFLVPNLLQIENRSIVVIDPKGELAAITAPYRRTIGEVIIINPFGVLADRTGYKDLTSSGYNPLRYLDPELPSFNAEASWLAEALITVEGNDPHWTRSARKLIAALIMYTRLRDGPDASLSTVRKLLTEPVVAPSRDRDGNSIPGNGLPVTALKMLEWKEPKVPALAAKAGQFTRWNREIESIVSTADTQTEALDDFEIAADLSKPGIDFRELKRRPITVYIILPPDMMERHARWLRLLLSAALRGVLRLREPGEMPVLFMIDEFAALGHLQIIETTWALVRGYGVALLPVLQDLNQLKALYKERWETFIGMAGVTAAFGPNDLTTAEWMSRRAGETTTIVENLNTGEGLSPGGHSQNQSSGFQQTKVPYLPAHDLFDTPTGHMHVWIANMKNTVPIYAPFWDEITLCEKRGRDNPYSVRKKAGTAT
jgi:type IV secretion system protein VirD4